MSLTAALIRSMGLQSDDLWTRKRALRAVMEVLEGEGLH